MKRTAAARFTQRFTSQLRINPHFRAPVPQVVPVEEGAGGIEVRVLPRPTQQDVEWFVPRIARQARLLLDRRQEGRGHREGRSRGIRQAVSSSVATAQGGEQECFVRPCPPRRPSLALRVDVADSPPQFGGLRHIRQPEPVDWYRDLLAPPVRLGTATARGAC